MCNKRAWTFVPRRIQLKKLKNYSRTRHLSCYLVRYCDQRCLYSMSWTSCVHLNSQSTGGDQRNLFWFRSDFLEIRWKKTNIIHKYNYFFKAYITNNGKKKLLNIFFFNLDILKLFKDNNLSFENLFPFKRYVRPS